MGLAGFDVFAGAAPVALAEESCPNAASRQGPSVNLPQCRVYEQVTPVDKGDSPDLFPSNGGSAFYTDPDPGHASEDGNHFLLAGEASFGDGVAYQNTDVFSRGPQGWTMTAISPGPGLHSIWPEVFNPADLSEVGVEDEQRNLVPGQPLEQSSAALVGPTGGPYTTVESLPLTAEGTVQYAMRGASADLSHVVLESKDHELAPGDTGQDEGSPALFEWVAGQMRLVNVATDGSLLSPCGAVLGDGSWGQGESNGSTHNAVSSDGSKILFTAPAPPIAGFEGIGCWNRTATPQENPPQLYMRLNGASTVDVSAPEPGVKDPDGLRAALYVGASSDDSKVFFITKTELTKGAVELGLHPPELYEYNTDAAEGQRLVRVSGGESGIAEGNVDFVGAISSDGSAVYFAAFGKLARGASALKEGEGANLYRYDTLTGKTTYIARINGNDYPLRSGETGIWYGGELPLVGTTRPTVLALSSRANWYATANGQYLVFGSDLPLTGYDSTKAPGVECTNFYPGGATPEQCVELFRYNAKAEENGEPPIVCVSCGPPDMRPIDDAYFTRGALDTPSGEPQRSISEDGDVFFETSNALVPQTTSGTVHVYEWHNGAISLISSANDTSNAYFLGASPDGSNVFIGTHAQLAPQDTDSSGDVYDARIDGGFVGVTPPLCTGTGCQGVPAAPPIFATPSSVTFDGIGNFPASRPPVKASPKSKQCKRGFVKKHGRCVKKKAKKSAKGRK